MRARTGPKPLRRPRGGEAQTSSLRQPSEKRWDPLLDTAVTFEEMCQQLREDDLTEDQLQKHWQNLRPPTASGPALEASPAPWGHEAIPPPSNKSQAIAGPVDLALEARPQPPPTWNQPWERWQEVASQIAKGNQSKEKERKTEEGSPRTPVALGEAPNQGSSAQAAEAAQQAGQTAGAAGIEE